MENKKDVRYKIRREIEFLFLGIISFSLFTISVLLLIVEEEIYHVTSRGLILFFKLTMVLIGFTAIFLMISSMNFLEKQFYKLHILEQELKQRKVTE